MHVFATARLEAALFLSLSDDLRDPAVDSEHSCRGLKNHLFIGHGRSISALGVFYVINYLVTYYMYVCVVGTDDVVGS